MSSTMTHQETATPLTRLSEDEKLFRSTVRQFAAENITPKVREMDEQQHMDEGIIRQLFELGLMGIEIPAEYGGAGGTFFSTMRVLD